MKTFLIALALLATVLAAPAVEQEEQERSRRSPDKGAEAGGEEECEGKHYFMKILVQLLIV